MLSFETLERLEIDGTERIESVSHRSSVLRVSKRPTWNFSITYEILILTNSSTTDIPFFEQ